MDRVRDRGNMGSGSWAGVDELFKLRSAILEDGGIGNFGIGRLNLVCWCVRFSIELSLANGKAA